MTQHEFERLTVNFMYDKEILLQEIKQEAENLKVMAQNEFESLADELSNISLSDFVPKCVLGFDINEFHKFTEECFSELIRRCDTVTTNQIKKIETSLRQAKFFQYNIVKTIENQMKDNVVIDGGSWTYSPLINLNVLQNKASVRLSCSCFVIWLPNKQVKHVFEEVFRNEIKSNKNKIVELYTYTLFKRIDEIISMLESAVTYKHITNDFGEGFLFSPQMIEVTENDVDSYMRAKEKDAEQLSNSIKVSVLESEKYSKIICVSRKIPTFDSSDREYDSWHELYLLQESNGIIHAVYCTGGYSIARIEGYAEVYEYPEYLRKYFE